MRLFQQWLTVLPALVAMLFSTGAALVHGSDRIPDTNPQASGQLRSQEPADSQEAPVIPLEPLRIDAAEFTPPVPGQANLMLQPGVVPEPFCTVEGTRRIDETSSTQKPRCCEVARDSAADCRCETGLPDRTGAGTGAAEARSELPASERRTAVFHEAAHFDTSEHRSGACYFKTPFVIYEGMTVTLTDDGCYEVRAMVDGPRLPAIVRLQLTFTSPEYRVTKITLPPIKLEPPADSATRLPYETQTWFVRRTGYIHLLNGWPHDRMPLSIARSGTAQAGQVPSL